MPDFVLVHNDIGALDRFGRTPPFLSQYGHPYPYLRNHAPTGQGRWQPIPERTAWEAAEHLLAAGGQLGEPERRALGIDLKASC